MSIADAMVGIEAHNSMLVMHDTWGHLFPTKKYYEGALRVAYTEYGYIDVLGEHDDLPAGSPWWADAASEFACDVSDEMERGEVAEFMVAVNIVDHKEINETWEEGDDDDDKYCEWQTIEISQLTKTILVKAF